MTGQWSCDMPRVLVPLAQGCEELEAITIIDLMRRAGIEVVTASLDREPVTCSRGAKLIADTDMDTALESDYDMVVLPGGLPGADNLDRDNRIRELLVRMADSEKFTAAICAAPKVLANAGLLDNKQATSFPGVLDNMKVEGMTYSESPVVRDGHVVTSRGPGTAMDFSLELIELLTSRDQRVQVEKALQRPGQG